MNVNLISVVIPSFNRPERLKLCIEALLNQDYIGDWEIIVVDDGSQPPLQQELGNVPVITSNKIRWFRQKNQGPAAARNLGINHARGNFVAFTDDDCRPAKDWLSQLNKMLRPGILIGGQTINGCPDNIFAEVNQLLIDYLYHFFNGTPQQFFTSNNLAGCKKTLLKLNGFDTKNFKTAAGEDRELCVRWRHLGFNLFFNKKAIVIHHHPQDFAKFKFMHIKYGSAAYPYLQKAAALNYWDNPPFVKKWIQSSTFLSGLLFRPFSKKKWPLKKKLSAIVLLGFSQLFGFLGYIKAAENSK